MRDSIILGLIYNSAILVTLSMLYDFFRIKNENTRNLSHKILAGIIISCIGILVMLTPWTYESGIVFDTRSILLSISGLFFGFIPTTIAIIILSLFRAYMGGGGMVMGIMVIISSGVVGILWQRLKPDWHKQNIYWQLTILGLVVHIIMLFCTGFLPSEKVVPTFKAILFSIILIYPAGTVLLGSLMVRRAKNWQAREDLIESQKKYKRLHESMTDAYVMCDMQGKILEFNSSFSKLLGYSDEELLSKNYKELTPEKWHETEALIVKNQVLIKGSSDVYEKEYIQKGGKPLPIEIRAFLIRDKDNQPKAMWALVRDISSRKKAEEELIRAKEKAEQNDRLKSLFLANMSHEIRTPMNGIFGFTQILRETKTDKQRREHYLDIINNSCERLFNVVNDLVDISKIESGIIDLKPTAVNINSLLDEIYDFHKNQCDKKGLTFSIHKHLSNEGAIIITDAKMLQQIISNLVNNAIKFTNEGKITLVYNVYGQWIEFSIADTGIGIDPQYQEIVFERFRQVEETYTRQHEGTGLGLSIAKAYVEKLGGRIWLDSRVNEGTNISFTIPYESADHEEVIRTRSRDLQSFKWQGKKILIAEDDEINFELIFELLSPTNCKIIHASNGEEAVSIYNKEKPDLILMDIKMPLLNGFEATKIIRKTDDSIPIIALTAYAYEADISKARELGINDYIAKPVNLNVLLSKIEMFLI